MVNLLVLDRPYSLEILRGGGTGYYPIAPASPTTNLGPCTGFWAATITNYDDGISFTLAMRRSTGTMFYPRASSSDDGRLLPGSDYDDFVEE